MPIRSLAALHVRTTQMLASGFIDLLTESEQRAQELAEDRATILRIFQEVKSGETDIEQVMVTDDGVRVIPRPPESATPSDNGAVAAAQVAPCEQVVPA
jgi:hypothetical protein